MPKKPNHVALTLSGLKAFARKHNVELPEVYRHTFSKVNDILGMQISQNIPILTLYVLHTSVRDSKDFSVIMDQLVKFFEDLAGNEMIRTHKVKVSVLGKWYNLPGRVVEQIKDIIDETGDYDAFFFNLCINYDGREEIADACRIIARKVQAGKLEPDDISKEMIKESIYSSYFLPPDILIKTGANNKLKGFLMWDTTESYIYFSGKPGV